MNLAARLRHGDFPSGNSLQLPPFQWRNALHGHLKVGLVVRMLDMPTGKRVLQVGCGSGIALPHLSRLRRPRVMVGIDIDSTVLGESADRLREKRVRTHLVQADGERDSLSRPLIRLGRQLDTALRSHRRFGMAKPEPGLWNTGLRGRFRSYDSHSVGDRGVRRIHPQLIGA